MCAHEHSNHVSVAVLNIAQEMSRVGNVVQIAKEILDLVLRERYKLD